MNKVLIIILLVSLKSIFAVENNVVYDLWPEGKSIVLTGSVKHHTYAGENGSKNYYAHFHYPQRKIENVLFLITGLEDPVPSWFETVILARKSSFRDIYVIELRGQGESSREIDKNIIHIGDFENYYKDLASAIKDINMKRALTKPSYIIAHSTGALVLVKAMDEIKKTVPNFDIAGMAFWTPLFKLKISPILDNFLVRPLIRLFNKAYKSCCGEYVARSFKPKTFEMNTVTTSQANFKRSEALRFKHKLGTEGVSLSWVLNAMEASKDIIDDVEKINIPTLILKAENEQVVSNDFKIDNPNVKAETIKGAKHALNIEEDSIHIKAWDETFQFWNIKK